MAAGPYPLLPGLNQGGIAADGRSVPTGPATPQIARLLQGHRLSSSRRLQPICEVIARRLVERQPVFRSAEQDVVGSLRPFNLAQITGLLLIKQPSEMPAEIGERSCAAENGVDPRSIKGFETSVWDD